MKEMFEHFEKVHGIKIFQCEECGKVFETKEEVKVHEKEEHEQMVHRKGFECILCDENFENESELEEHWEIEHEDNVFRCIHLNCEEKYICQELQREHMIEKHGIGF